MLIDGKSFFNFPVKSEEEVCKRFFEMNRNNDYSTGSLLDYAYFKKD